MAFKGNGSGRSPNHRPKDAKDAKNAAPSRDTLHPFILCILWGLGRFWGSLSMAQLLPPLYIFRILSRFEDDRAPKDERMQLTAIGCKKNRAAHRGYRTYEAANEKEHYALHRGRKGSELPAGLL
jgi:hypothetical protein